MNICKNCNELENKINSPCLVCNICKAYVHLKCLQSKTTPGTIFGDVFFTYTCELCNDSGEETFERNKLSWFQTITLALFDLSKKSFGLSKQGYFHWRDHIAAYISKYWDLLFKKDIKKKKNWMGTISGQLSTHSKLFFRSGADLLGENGWWKPTLPNLTPEIISFLESEIVKTKLDRRNRGKCIDEIDLLNNLLSCYGYSKHEVSFQTKQKSLSHEPVPSTSSRLSESLDNSLDWLSEQEMLNYNLQTQDIFETVSSNDNTDFESRCSSSIGTELFEFKNVEYNQKPNQNDHQPKKITNQGQKTFKSPQKLKPWLSDPNKLINIRNKGTVSLSYYEENYLFKKLLAKQHSLISNERRLLAKLRLRKLKRAKHLPLFNIDDILNDVKTEQKMNTFLDRYCYHNTTFTKQVNVNNFLTRIAGLVEPKPILSPYTSRTLKPFIRRDSETTPIWLQLMNELQIKVHKKLLKQQFSPINDTIDYCYVKPEHIAGINSLCELFFWPGIDLSEALQYPDFSCVVLYKKIIIGFAFMIPDVNYNECYISFILTRPEWRRSGIATFMLYHLVQTCMGKDITLHVSATNPAMILYQKFGFKVEEFVQNFYEKYLPSDNNDCRHAIFLRLSK